MPCRRLTAAPCIARARTSSACTLDAQDAALKLRAHPVPGLGGRAGVSACGTRCCCPAPAGRAPSPVSDTPDSLPRARIALQLCTPACLGPGNLHGLTCARVAQPVLHLRTLHALRVGCAPRTASQRRQVHARQLLGQPAQAEQSTAVAAPWYRVPSAPCNPWDVQCARPPTTRTGRPSGGAP